MPYGHEAAIAPRANCQNDEDTLPHRQPRPPRNAHEENPGGSKHGGEKGSIAAPGSGVSRRKPPRVE